MTESEIRQIEVTRVLCILCMMWVHIAPGLSTPSVVTQGEYQLVGALLGQTLGRIGVTTLSFISGYLLWHFGMRRPTGVFAAQRVRNLALPMLVWSAFFIILVLVKHWGFGHQSTATARLGPAIFDWVNSWTGLAAPTANLSLFFLRDLFVTSLILRLALPIIVKMPVAVLALVLGLTLMSLTAPVVFRPNILLFTTFGVLAGRWGLSLAMLSRPALALPLGYGLVLGGYLPTVLELAGTPSLDIAAALARRAGFGFLMLTLTAVLVDRFRVDRLARIGRHAFLAYLMHVPFTGVLWSVWVAAIGDHRASSYLIFFIATPFLAYGAAVALGLVLDRCPAVMQICLRGKARA